MIEERIEYVRQKQNEQADELCATQKEERRRKSKASQKESENYNKMLVSAAVKNESWTEFAESQILSCAYIHCTCTN